MVDIRRERLRADLSQARLAELAGIAQSNLSAYESGKRPASDVMVKRILDAMARPSDLVARFHDEIQEIVLKFGATNPRIFGSVARREDTPTSDLDLLVTVPPGAAWTFGRIAPELEKRLGIHVDVVSDRGLSPDRHGDILAEALPL